MDVTYDERGLVPAVVQDARDGAVLMLAWMNADALAATRQTGLVHFWSRSRKKLWQKGETSGNTLAVVELRLDCDGDAILVRAIPAGPTCHTGERSCFFTEEDSGPPGGIADSLERVLVSRRDESDAGTSYTKSLLDRGAPTINQKITEEAGELTDELPSGPPGKVVHETADLLFHVMVGLVWRRIPLADIWAELQRRFGTSGHTEKASRSK